MPVLNKDHRDNLTQRADAVASAVHKAWTYLQVLKGMRAAVTKTPGTTVQHPLAFDSIYRAMFEALYAAVGTITDTRKDVESIHTLVTMARRYPIDEQVRKEIKAALNRIEEVDGSPLRRLSEWRNKHTSHRTTEAYKPEFYEKNKLDLHEVEDAITALDSALSDITYPLIQARYSLRPSTDKVASSCEDLFLQDVVVDSIH